VARAFGSALRGGHAPRSPLPGLAERRRTADRGAAAGLRRHARPRARLPMTFRFGWFTTARGPGSRGMYEAVAKAIADGRLDAEFAFVFANRERGENPLTDSFF